MVYRYASRGSHWLYRNYFRPVTGSYFRRRYKGNNYSQMLKDIAFLKSVINVEHKAHDTAITANPDNVTGTVNNLCLIAQGDDVDNRNGRSIRLKSVQVKGTIESGTTNANVVRLLIVKTLNNQSAAPALDDVLQSIDVNALRNIDDNQRSFVVIHDRYINLSPEAGTNVAKSFNYYRKLGSHMSFSGTAATEASAGKGALYLMMVSDRGTLLPTATLNCRVRFIDN